ncbi:MAG: type II toxin-antitoxin system VapC family toxin [Acidobacteriota bacterium]
MVLLDTSGYSAFRRGHAEISARLKKSSRIYLNPVVLGELHQGFRQGGLGAKNEAELEHFLQLSRVHLLDITPDSADFYASIVTSLRRAGTPIPTNDIWIAATAMQYTLPIVTTDPHFERVGQVATLLFPVRSEER